MALGQREAQQVALASSEQVREVSGDTVRLGVAGKQLPVQE